MFSKFYSMINLVGNRILTASSTEIAKVCFTRTNLELRGNCMPFKSLVKTECLPCVFTDGKSGQ